MRAENLDAIRIEQAWFLRVESEGLHCRICGLPPSQRESVGFLRSGCCAYCTYHPLVREVDLTRASPRLPRR